MLRVRETQEIAAAAQRQAKTGVTSELEGYSLKALKQADAQLSGRDEASPYRQVIRQQIQKLESLVDSKHESNVRTLGYVVALVITIIGVAVAKYFMT
jgi:hypothetical protein